MKTVAIFGVGLIGGSFALALRRAGFDGIILGVSSQRTIAAAVERGVIDRGVSEDEACAEADWIYLAQPVSAILQTLDRIGPRVRAGALVTDAGSTKGLICEQGRRAVRAGAVFLGGHPMAGKESSGVAAADAGLFEGRVYLLTPDDPLSEWDRAEVAEFRRWIARIGAKELVMTPAEHDRVVAFTSHLPQLASTALALTTGGELAESGGLEAAGPALGGMTRLALSSWEMWGDISVSNRYQIDRALGAYIDSLVSIREKLADKNLEDVFTRAGKHAKKIRR